VRADGGHRNGGRGRNGQDEPDGRGERSDGLLGDVLGGEEVEYRPVVNEQQQQDRRGGARVGEHDGVDGRGDVVAADSHGAAE
jgi:hypothetical protein